MSPDAPPVDPLAAKPAPQGHDSTDRPPVSAGRRPSPLSVTAITLAGTGTVLGITLLWAFVALPVSLAGVVCAFVARRRVKSLGLPTHPVDTVAMTLGMVAVVLSLSSLLAVPLLRGQLADVNDGVQDDLRSVEHSFRGSIDALDRTMTRNVDHSARALRRDFASLEKNSKEELSQVESQLHSLVQQLQTDVSKDLERLTNSSRSELAELERSLREDDRLYVGQLRSLEQTVRTEASRLQAQINTLQAEIDRIEKELENLGAG